MRLTPSDGVAVLINYGEDPRVQRNLSAFTGRLPNYVTPTSFAGAGLWSGAHQSATASNKPQVTTGEKRR